MPSAKSAVKSSLVAALPRSFFAAILFFASRDLPSGFDSASAAFDTSLRIWGLAAYKLQRPEHSSGDGADVATAIESEINGQTRSKEFEFRVLAMNKAGDGESSNSVSALQ